MKYYSKKRVLEAINYMEGVKKVLDELADKSNEEVIAFNTIETINFRHLLPYIKILCQKNNINFSYAFSEFNDYRLKFTLNKRIQKEDLNSKTKK